MFENVFMPFITIKGWLFTYVLSERNVKVIRYKILFFNFNFILSIILHLVIYYSF